jgi:hypothetical protein
MWVFLFLLFIQANSNPCPPSPAQTQSPSLIVQVVDPVWLPVPGAEVTLKPLSTGAKSNRTETDKDGYARFSVPGDADYSIEAKLYGFKRERLKRVHLLKTSGSSAPAYVQLQLRLSGPGTTVY